MGTDGHWVISNASECLAVLRRHRRDRAPYGFSCEADPVRESGLLVRQPRKGSPLKTDFGVGCLRRDGSRPDLGTWGVAVYQFPGGISGGEFRECKPWE